jgi:hypothetical protein
MAGKSGKESGKKGGGKTEKKGWVPVPPRPKTPPSSTKKSGGSKETR